MPISSGACGRRIAGGGSRSRPPSSARSTPNLAIPPQQLQQQQVSNNSRMIDAPPRVEARRRLGSQTLYGSRPPWATDEDAPTPSPQPQSQPQPPFYPAGGDLPHGEAVRMRRLKAARELYKSPSSRRQHNTGSVDDLLRDCRISDHSHSPSPVRRTPSSNSSIAARPRHSTRSVGVGGGSGDKDSRDNKVDSATSDNDSPDGRQRGRQRHRRTSRGTSPPPQVPPQHRPLYVDTGCDAADWAPPPPAAEPPPQRQSGGFGRSKMPAGLKPASERKYVPPPPPATMTTSASTATGRRRSPVSPVVRRHDCLPGESPPFKARPMPDFSRQGRRISPSPARRSRSRSQSPAVVSALAAVPLPPTAVGAQTSSATSGYRSSGGGSGGSPRRHQQQQRQRRRSMDEDSLTETSGGSAGRDGRPAEARDVVDTAPPARVMKPPSQPPQSHRARRDQNSGITTGHSSVLVVPDKALRDRSVTDLDLDEIFGTAEDRTKGPMMANYGQVAVDGGSEVNQRIQYWLKRNIYFHASEPGPDANEHNAFEDTPGPDGRPSRSRQPRRRMEILVQRTEELQQRPPEGARRSQPPRHVSTVEYPVRKFQQLPNGYVSPSSSGSALSQHGGEDAEVGVGQDKGAPGAEILRQAVVYARSRGAAADTGSADFWFSAENGGAPRSLATAYNGAPASSIASSSSARGERGGGRVRALASRFSQQQPPAAATTGVNGDFVSSYQQAVTPAVSSRHRGHRAPAVAAQLRPAMTSAAAGGGESNGDSKTFYFGDEALVRRREQPEHWASGYFNRPNVEIIDRVNGHGGDL